MGRSGRSLQCGECLRQRLGKFADMMSKTISVIDWSRLAASTLMRRCISLGIWRFRRFTAGIPALILAGSSFPLDMIAILDRSTSDAFATLRPRSLSRLTATSHIVTRPG